MNQWNLVFLGVLISVLSIVVGAIAFRPIPLTAQTQPVAYEFCFFGRQETVGINNSGEIDNGDLGRHRVTVPSGWMVVTAVPGYGGFRGGLILFCR